MSWTNENGYLGGGDCGEKYKLGVKNYHFSNDTFSLIIRPFSQFPYNPTNVKISKKIDSGWLATFTVGYCYNSPILNFRITDLTNQ